MDKNKVLGKLRQVMSLITCVMLLIVVAVQRDGKVLGKNVRTSTPVDSVVRDSAKSDTLRTMVDGTIIISTRELAKDVVGYAAPIPLEIYVKDGRIVRVVALAHSETPSFFESVEDAGLLKSWDGLTINEAMTQKVDAVSGATYSSDAVIESVSRGLNYLHSLSEARKLKQLSNNMDLKSVLLLLVLCSAIVLPIFWRSKRYRIIQLVLNVVVLGFWTGTFLSYSSIVHYVSYGLDVRTAIVSSLLLFTAFVLPLLGRKSHYCRHVCPMGALQELAGRSISHKIKMSGRLVRILSTVRDGLWAILMILMICGLLFEWMDYEVFSAFLFAQASIPVMIIAIVFVSLSFVVWHPYCRFVCPTGTLFRMSQGAKYRIK